MAVKKICTYPGCNNLCNYGEQYCSKHKYLEADKKDFGTAISTYATTYNHLYHTQRWIKESKQFLKDNPLCCRCGNRSEVTDHIIPHRGNEELFWNKNNWEPLCKRCHDIKTREEIHQRQKDEARSRELIRRYGKSW